MAHFIRFLILCGTLCCSVFASGPETVRFDREELSKALDRYAEKNPGFIPDLRPSSQPGSGWSASGRRVAYRCLSCDRDHNGRIRSSPVARREFRSQNACLATGEKRGACPGYVIDHIISLKRGGADNAENMQWQSIGDAKAKDRVE